MKKSETCLNKKSVKNNINLPLLILVAGFAILYFFATFFDFYDFEYNDFYGNYSLFQELRYSASNATLEEFGFHYYTFAYSQTAPCEVMFGILFALISFNFLLNKNKLYTHLSFAKSRKSFYIGKTAIPLICGGIVISAVKLISAIANGIYLGVTSNLIRGIIASTLTSFMLFTMGYAVTVIAHLFTGRRVEAYMFIASAFTLPNAIECTVINTFSANLSGFARQDYYSYAPLSNEVSHFFEYANPTYCITDYSASGEYISVKDFVSFKYEYIISTLWLCIFIGALILCGKYFSGKFKPENVGKKAKSKLVTIISSVSIPLFVTQQINRTSYFAIDNPQNMYVILMSTGIAFVMFTAVIIIILITRSAKASLWGAIGGGTIAVMQVICLVIALTGCFGFTTRIPDKNDIESIKVSLPFDDMISNTTEKFFFSDSVEYYDDFWVSESILTTDDSILITDESDFDIVRNIHNSVLEKSDDKTSITFNVTYTLKNGRSINRRFPYISDSAAKEFINVWKTKPIQDGLKVLLNQDENADYKAYPQDQSSYSTSSSTVNPYLYDEHEDVWGSSSDVVFAIKPENVFIASKDMQVTSLSAVTKDAESLPDFSEERTLELMGAIYKDAQLLSAEEWFAPEKELGAIAFCEYDDTADNIATYEFFKLADAIFYINSNMKNTLAVLDKYDYTKYFECKKEVIAAHLVDVNDVVKWKRSLNESYLSDYHYNQKGLHGTYFTQDYYEISGYIVNGCNYRNINIFSENGEVKEVFYPDELFPVYEDGYNMTTQEAITNLTYAKGLVKDAYLAYNVGNHGKFLVVKFADGTQAMLVVPEKNN
ncbi:MAG: hypothetical protein J6D06_09935 [Clostridia bacterium]|nr:hypothetical protein [Clostridia bacterium]